MTNPLKSSDAAVEALNDAIGFSNVHGGLNATRSLARRVELGGFMIVPIPPARQRLGDLVSKTTDQNRHEEFPPQQDISEGVER